MISAFFINRPVLANVLAIVIVLIGGVALMTLPVAQYPNVVPPTVQVTTTYPGASAKVVVDNVALPVELQVNGVEKMIYMQSYSTDAGTYTLTVTFEIGTDLDFAQVLVQNKVSAALASLPASVQAQGLIVEKKSTSILQIVSLTSPDQRYDSLYLSNYATINLVNELSRLPGVGNVNVLGVGQYSMRVWLDPEKLYTFGLTPSDVTPRHPAAEPGRERGPGRHAAGAQGAGLPVHDRRRRPPQHARGIQQHHRQGRPRAMAAGSSASRTSAASSSAPRPTPRPRRSTASPIPASPSTSSPMPTPSTSPSASTTRWPSFPRTSRRALPTTCRSTPPAS